MKVLFPFSTQPLSERTAVVRAPAASEPEPGSVNPHAPSHSPEASRGTHLRRCSSFPATKIWFVASELCAATMIPIDPSTADSSSIAST